MEQQEQKRGGKGVWIGLGLAVVIAGGVGLYLLRARTQGTYPISAVKAPPPAPVQEAAGPAPSKAESDALLRSWGSRISNSPVFAKWLAGEDLARQFVAAVQLIAEGESPRQLLGFLKPEGNFAVEERDGKLFVAPASTARYDFVAQAVDSIDVNQAAQAWGFVEPVLSAVYREISPPGSSLKQTLSRAFDVLVSAPVPEGDVELVEKGATYAYADPALEALPAAQKHLMRMGAANQKTLQAKLQAVQRALGLTMASR